MRKCSTKPARLNRGFRSGLIPAFSLLIALLLPGIAGAGDGRGYLEMRGGYTTGDFGTTVSSDLYSVSAVFGHVSSEADVSLTVPYLFLSTSGEGISRDDSGIGDLVARGGMRIVPEGRNGFSLSGSLSVKLPTADEDKGLGTGEADYGAFLSAHQRTPLAKVVLFAGYILTGDPSNTELNNVTAYGAGLSRVFQLTEVYVSFEGRRALFPGFDDPAELHAGMFHVLNKDYAVKGHGFAGLNDGGPDYGLDIGIVRWF